ncbi:hypothetical protein ACJIZ3_018704 [Penstemon smallii]|uniref:Uncharacterized protein n=1 Tax=Penstemon smallii TaxID=265156 RepID=A0ABD3SZ60_9LAMI
MTSGLMDQVHIPKPMEILVWHVPMIFRMHIGKLLQKSLWGFVFDSKYEEIIASLCTEPPGICHW